MIYAKTVPLYRRIGSEPDIIGSRGEGARQDLRRALADLRGGAGRDFAQRSGIPVSVMARWFDASFPARYVEERIAA